MFTHSLLMAAGASIATGGAGYVVDYSCRFNDDDSAYLYRTFGTPSDNTEYTFSSWVKRANISSQQMIFSTATGEDYIEFNSDDKLNVHVSSSNYQLITTQVFRDPAAWYHILVSYDFDNSTANDRIRIFVNGSEVTAFSTRSNPPTGAKTMNTAVIHAVGRYQESASLYYDGYLSQTVFIDGQSVQNGGVSTTSFGETGSNGVWRPVNVTGLTFGDNGFLLDFANASDLGNDVGGNNNDFSSSGISSNDRVPDTPTINYPTFSPLATNTAKVTLSDGNLKSTSSTSGGNIGRAWLTQALPTSGKVYFEMTVDSIGVTPTIYAFGQNGLMRYRQGDDPDKFWYLLGTADTLGGRVSGGMTDSIAYGSNTGTGLDSNNFNLNWSNGDVFGFAYDATNGYMWLSKNDSWLDGSVGGASSATVKSDVESGTSGRECFSQSTGGVSDVGMIIGAWSQSVSSFENTFNAGQLSFSGSAPEGFSSWTSNIQSNPSIEDGTSYFQTTLYTGNGSTRSIDQSGNSSFQPDLVWLKNRDTTDGHKWVDAARAVQKEISSDSTSAESTNSNGLTSFDSNGFGLGTGADGYNDDSETFVAWQWLAGGGSGSSNTDGSINTTTTSVNTTSGISISTYTGTGSTATIGHGLGAVPKMILIKNRSATNAWAVYHASASSAPETDYLVLDTTAAPVDDVNYWNDTTPTSSVFTIKSDGAVNTSSATYVAYAFAEIEGFSNFHSYIGSGQENGSIIYVGFSPNWVMIKKVSGTGSWVIYDRQRSTYNEVDDQLLANVSTAETTGSEEIDFLSNGFKIRTTDSDINTSQGDYVYAAFAEYPFGGKTLPPATAR